MEPPNDALASLVGDSAAFPRVRANLEQVAPTNATVLLIGETGTGKSIAAAAIHALSTRRGAQFVTVDCTALPATLVESELFGRERGAFTDAHTAQAGRFEIANGGTLFLDEIGELPIESQVKLLRVLQFGELERLGSARTIRVDVRVVAATNRDLAADVSRGRFRPDLFYRLSVFPVTLPPLRQRRSDIQALARHTLVRLSQRHRCAVPALPPDVLDSLLAYDFAPAESGPGTSSRSADRPSSRLIDVQRLHIVRTLASRDWRVEGADGAACALGLRPSTLRDRMRKLGISRDSPGERPPA